MKKRDEMSKDYLRVVGNGVRAVARALNAEHWSDELAAKKSRVAAFSLLGAAFTAICAQIAFYLPGNPVPITMQVFAVLCCGLMLGSKLGALAQIEYLVVGMLGAPVFAGFKGGWAYIAGPTGGYLVGFVFAAFAVGLFAERLGRESIASRCLAALVGVVVIYTFGRAWLAVWLGDVSSLKSWMLGVAPFVGLDIAKAMLAATLCRGRR